MFRLLFIKYYQYCNFILPYINYSTVDINSARSNDKKPLSGTHSYRYQQLIKIILLFLQFWALGKICASIINCNHRSWMPYLIVHKWIIWRFYIDRFHVDKGSARAPASKPTIIFITTSSVPYLLISHSYYSDRMMITYTMMSVNGRIFFFIFFI